MTARHRVLIAAGVLLLLAQQALLWWLYYHAAAKQLVGDEVQYMAAAQAIVAGGPWQPGHVWPPGQAVLIAAMLRGFGNAVLALQLLQTALLFACGGLLYRLCRRLGGAPLAAAAAAGMFLLNPSDAAYAHYLWPELEHLALLLLALNLLLPRAPAVPGALLAGGATGAALLFKSLLAGFWPLLLLPFAERAPRWRVRWAGAAAFLLGLLLVSGPALLAGHRNTGHYSIADSSMFNLLAGLSDHERNDYVDDPVGVLFGDYLNSAPDADGRNAWARAQVAQKLATEPWPQVLADQLGRQYFRLFESKTLLLTQLPAPVCAGYIGAYHDTPSAVQNVLRWWSHLLHALILVGFAFGLCLWREWRALGIWLLLASLAYQLALYGGLHVKARYLLPMIPVFCLFGGELVAYCAGSGQRLQATPLRLLAAVLLAALLLCLAFAGPWLDGYCRG